MDNKDFDFIKNKFDADGVKAPDSISENNMIKRLTEKPKVKFYNKKSFKSLVSVAACFAVVLGVITFQQVRTGGEPQGYVTSFNNYGEIKAQVNKLNRVNLFDISNYSIKGDKTEYSYGDSAAEGGADYSNAESSYNETYVQVEGVDEADIIKNDGKYIYYVTESCEVMIYEGEQLISSIDDFKIDYESDEYYYASDYCYVNDIYVKGDRLIVNISNEEYVDEEYVTNTVAYIYDISDITSPIVLESFSQSGYYITSRMIENQLYIISSKHVYDCETEKDCYIYTTQGEGRTTLPATSVYCGENMEDSSYVVISAIDINDCKRTADPKAFFGCGATVYCNQNNLYLAIYGENNTEIVKAVLEADSISFTATTTVPGYVDSQFAMDEKDGYLRVATSDNKANNLFVLDENLNKVGEVTGFAENESIQAVKYIGDMAYVITFEYIDPLFVIDLSDPTSPVIKGSLEIIGFSSQLMPVDENTLLGIGYDDTFGMKLALFDISNPSSPTVLDSISMPNYSSEAQYNHRAIVVNREEGYFALDYSDYEYDNDTSGAMVVKIIDGKINITQKYEIDPVNEYAYARRVTYIGDTFYVLDSEGFIYTFGYNN